MKKLIVFITMILLLGTYTSAKANNDFERIIMYGLGTLALGSMLFNNTRPYYSPDPYYARPVPRPYYRERPYYRPVPRRGHWEMRREHWIRPRYERSYYREGYYDNRGRWVRGRWEGRWIPGRWVMRKIWIRDY